MDRPLQASDGGGGGGGVSDGVVGRETPKHLHSFDFTSGMRKEEANNNY